MMLFILCTTICLLHCGFAQHEIQTNEVFMLPLSPASFNISSTDSAGVFSYLAALHGMPDLPKWIQLVHNPLLKLGFLFGTPPQDAKYIKLDVTASNQYTFETYSKQITLEVYPSTDSLNSQLKMKIHNLNVEDFMDDSKRERFFDIFRTILWPECAADLHLVELHSALAAGGRRPARRTDGEGVILTLGSQADFSEILRDLEREVSPLWAFRNCPRDFKKTSAERHFRTKGFLVDWCSFKLTPQNSSLLIPSSTPPTDFGAKTDGVTYAPTQMTGLDVGGIWKSPTKDEIPVRSYAEEGVVAIFIPLMLLLALAALLTAILGVHPEGNEVEEGQLYEIAFEELSFLKPGSKKEPSESTERNKETELIPSAEQDDVPLPVEMQTGTVGRPPSIPASSRTSISNTASLSRGAGTNSIRRNHHMYAPALESVNRGSSPFLMTSASQTPVSTLTRSAYRPGSRSGTLGPSERASTLGRPEPPPYSATLNKYSHQ